MSQVQNPAAYERAIRARIVMNARIGFERDTPDADAIISFVRDRGINWNEGEFSYKNNFFGSLADALATYGKLSPKQCSAVRRIMADDAEKRAKWDAERAAAAAKSEWVGQIGDRIEMLIKVNHSISIESQFGYSYMYFCEDADGNKVVFKGTAAFLAKGETGRIKATIKAHEEYKGAKQTRISRPVILD